ncbi:Golgi transport complex subunit 5-domain-containing protein [Dichotomocladium elegans]|nr:Golgi transport complex subunit 5-domain-containing protein [Dichotomocladium elegans]
MSTQLGLQEADVYIEYDKFLSENFDVNGYADSIINTSPGTGDGSEITTALSNLSFNITSLEKQIQNEIAANYDTLLGQVRGIRELEIVLATVQTNVNELRSSLARLSSKIRTPYNQLRDYNIQLEHLQETSDILRRIHRFLVLARRLEAQLGNVSDNDMAAAALTLYEIEAISQEKDLDGIDIVTNTQPFIGKSRAHIEKEATKLLEDGLTSRNQTRMAAGLQILYNMKQVEEKVKQVVNNMLDKLASEIHNAVDMSSLQKQMRATGSTAVPAVRRVNNEPTFASQGQWAEAIWTRMETLMESMADGCINLYGLEKVLDLKKDSFTQISYLEVVLKVTLSRAKRCSVGTALLNLGSTKTLDANSLMSRFWRQLSSSFEKELREATKGSTFLRSTFINEYPKLHRLLQSFLSQVARHNCVPFSDFMQTPEYIIMIRSIAVFESAYKAKTKRENSQ